jgi:hypothetical protein
MVERRLRKLSSLVLLCAPLALVSLSAACGGSSSNEDGGAGTGAGAPSIGGALGGSPGSASTSGASGAADGGAFAGSAASSGSPPPHQELCSLWATCENGVIHGVLGNYCLPFSATCELGCRTDSYSHGYLGNEHDFDTALASGLARAGLCNDRDGSTGADDEGGAGGAPAFGEAGAAQTGGADGD